MCVYHIGLMSHDKDEFSKELYAWTMISVQTIKLSELCKVEDRSPFTS